jgi:hypothetical protein
LLFLFWTCGALLIIRLKTFEYDDVLLICSWTKLAFLLLWWISEDDFWSFLSLWSSSSVFFVSHLSIIIIHTYWLSTCSLTIYIETFYSYYESLGIWGKKIFEKEKFGLFWTYLDCLHTFVAVYQHNHLFQVYLSNLH